MRKVFASLVLVLVCACSAWATSITISSSQIAGYSYTDAAPKIRVYNSQAFLTSDGTWVPASAVGSANWYLTISCTANLTTHVLSIPSFVLPSTVNGSPNTSRFTLVLFTGNTKRETIYSNFRVPTSYGTTITVAQWVTDNQVAPSPPRPGFPDTQQVQTMINAVLPAPKATTTVEGIGRASVVPTDALHPVFMVDNDPRIGVTYNPMGAPFNALCDGVTNDTVAFQSLNTFLGSTKAKLKMPGGRQCLVGNLTLPATLTVDYTDGGAFKGVNSTTLTIVGPQLSAAAQIFYNYVSGGATVSFSGNTAQKNFHVAWWGADAAAAGAATNSAIDAALAAVPDAGTLHLSPRKTYSVTGLTWSRKFSATLLGADSLSGTVSTGSAPTLLYVGADGGTILRGVNLYRCTIKGIIFAGSASGGSVGADVGIHLDQEGGGSPPISTFDTITGNLIQADSTRPGWIAIKIDNVSGTNNEQHEIDGNYIVGGLEAYPNQTGIGIYLGHANVKAVKVRGNGYTGLAKFVSSASGSFRAAYNQGGSSLIAYHGIISDAVSIENDESEDNAQIISIHGGGYAPIRMVSSRHDDLRGGQAITASTSDAPVIDVGNPTTIVGCEFGAGGSRVFTSDFIKDFTGGQSPLAWENNIVNNADANHPMSADSLNAGFLTFATVSRPAGGRGAVAGQGGTLVGGAVAHQNSLQGLMSSPMSRDLIGVQQSTDDGATVAAQNSIAIGESGQIEIAGLARSNLPAVTYVGSNDGGQAMVLSVMAVDAAGNRTMPSLLLQNVAANTTLSVSNYAHVSWPKVPNASTYILLQFSSGNWRTIATGITPSGTNVESYDIVANPAGAYTYTIPTYNETAWLVQRGSIATTVTATDGNSNYTVKPSDSVITCNATASDYSLTLPAAAAGNKGRRYTFIRVDASGNLPTISGNGTNINGSATYTGLSAQYKRVVVVSTGAIWLIESSN